MRHKSNAKEGRPLAFFKSAQHHPHPKLRIGENLQFAAPSDFHSPTIGFRVHSTSGAIGGLLFHLSTQGIRVNDAECLQHHQNRKEHRHNIDDLFNFPIDRQKRINGP